MYRQQIAKKKPLSNPSTAINKPTTPTPSYGSLSGTIQRGTASPESLREDEWQQLDSALGIRGMKQIKAGVGTSPATNFVGLSNEVAREQRGNQLGEIQRKIQIGKEGDKYEREADRVANEVVKKSYTAPDFPRQKGSYRQQMEGSRRKGQRMLSGEQRSDEAMDRRKRRSRRRKSDSTHGGRRLGRKIIETMGEAMEADFREIRVHTDTEADEMNRGLQSVAFTQGRDIYFRKGEYTPGTYAGRWLIAHELAHAVQQRAVSRLTPETEHGPRVQKQDPSQGSLGDMPKGEGKKVYEKRGQVPLMEYRERQVVSCHSEVHHYYQEIRRRTDGPGQLHDRVAIAMAAYLDPSDGMRGTGASQGGPVGGLVDDIRALYPTLNFVRGHLLNSDLGGIGLYYNLYPITGRANSDHSGVEERVKEELIGLRALEMRDRIREGNYAIYYEVIIERLYGPAQAFTIFPDARIHVRALRCRRTDNNRWTDTAVLVNQVIDSVIDRDRLESRKQQLDAINYGTDGTGSSTWIRVHYNAHGNPDGIITRGRMFDNWNQRENYTIRSARLGNLPGLLNPTRPEGQ